MNRRSAMKSKLPLLRGKGPTILLAATLALFSFAAAFAQQGAVTAAAPSEFSVALRQISAAGRLADLRWADFSDYRVHVTNFYASADYAPAWLINNEPTQQAQTVIDVLKQAPTEGLNAEDYDGSRWADRLARLRQSPTPADQARFDAALTVCAMRYISDLHIGRINPQHFKFNLDVSTKKYDLPVFLRDKIANSADVRAALDQVEPPFAGYKRTLQALQQYMDLSQQDDGEQLPVPIKPIEPGGVYAGVPRLTRLLRLLGDIPNGAAPDSSSLYAGPLVDGVKHFQSRHGLTPDGRLGAQTVKQLNVPLSFRVELALGAVPIPSTAHRSEYPRISPANLQRGRHDRSHDERDRGQGLSARNSRLRKGHEVRGLPSVLERAAQHPTF